MGDGNRIGTARVVAAAFAFGLLPLAGPLRAQPAPPPARPAAPPQAAFEAARAAFARLPEAERRAIQDALVWTGDYSAAASGGFGPLTFRAILAYQRRARLAPGGVLDAQERAGLQAAARRGREALDFSVVTDRATGIRIGVPARTLSKRGQNPNGGARWQSADGRITLDTRAIPAGESDLGGLYERNLAIQTPGRQVTYTVLRGDFFVITGETATGKFYTRYAAGPSGLRGFSLGYDKGLAKEFDRTVVAIANSFEPFPSVTAAPADAAPPPPPPPPARPAAIQPPRSAGLIATGLAVSPRKILTTAAVEACPALRVGPAPARLAHADKTTGLALLEINAEAPVSAAGLRTGPVTPGTAMVVLAFQQAGQTSSLVVAPGDAESNRSLFAPLQPGAGGAPAFDRSGALAGLVGPMPDATRRVAGIVPPTRYRMVPAPEVARFLEGAGVTIPSASPAPERTAGEIAFVSGPAVVAVECSR